MGWKEGDHGQMRVQWPVKIANRPLTTIVFTLSSLGPGKAHKPRRVDMSLIRSALHETNGSDTPTRDGMAGVPGFRPTEAVQYRIQTFHYYDTDTPTIASHDKGVIP
ncbi:Hypothetical protein NTJ_01738 [Nesidiocoris tenuis]|uniref:Uncharacterized protein n=1 Tax=Nesidiocoris tenuis TaxID=355587 RepID=A0ABN7A9E0_9HEMI|nr:Hypothetical protein NTJ_01738 [Nesidiocoris tenuis]